MNCDFLAFQPHLSRLSGSNDNHNNKNSRLSAANYTVNQSNNKNSHNIMTSRQKYQSKHQSKQSNLHHKNINKQLQLPQKKNKLRDQQSSDYIRNLYKKYLGKENIENYTQRKLKTDIKDTINTNNISKDLNKNLKQTKRMLFANNNQNQTNMQIKVDLNTSTKKSHKISAILIENQDNQRNIQLNMNKMTQRTSNTLGQVTQRVRKGQKLDKNQRIQRIQRQSTKNHQTPKRINDSRITLKEKQKQKQKISNQNYTSRSKKKQNPNTSSTGVIHLGQSTPTMLKKSQSTQLKKEKQFTLEKQNQKQRQKQKFKQTSRQYQKRIQSTQIYQNQQNVQRKQIQKQRINFIQQNLITDTTDSAIYPNSQILNRNLYCQFTTEDQTKNRIKTGNIYETFINDTQMLGIVTDKNSSIYKALNKINKAKKKKISQNKFT